jgi:acyl-CoA synthetase (AMP-forming)/AMP-acid ligase II
MRVPLTIGDFLERAALVYGDRVAVVDEPGVPGSLGRLTYAELHDRARALAVGLDAMGLAAGDRVAIVSPNSARFLASYFGVSGFGRVLVPINFRLSADEIAYIVEHSGSTVVLYDPELDEVMAQVGGPRRIRLDGIEDAALFDPAAGRLTEPIGWTPDEEATCSINYTSGTTARPKGVQLTHRNCWLNAVSFGWHIGVSDRDVLLHTLPMFHANGWGMPYAVTGMGGRHVVQRKIDGEVILSRIEEEEITLLCAAPAVVASILGASEARRAEGRPLTANAVRVVVAGAPPPSKTIERVERELGWEFIQIYGLTETSPLLTLNRAPAEWDELGAEERARRLGRAGVPAVGVRIAVSEDGEVLAKSNHVFEGYWKQPDESATALEGGWFHTGDGGYQDGPYTVITDRKKDVIITGGENVSSIEVEDVLYQHEAVAEVAVIGVPDDKWGEKVLALVVLRPGAAASEQDLIEHCRDRIAHFKAPRTVEIRQVLARTATGKLQKYKLRQPYWEGRDRQVN